MSKGARGARLRAATALALMALIIASVAVACGGASGPAGLLEGKVTLGPIAPIEAVGGPPNTRLYAAIVDVETPAGDVVKTVASNNDGTFSLRLAAGSYRLVPRSPKGKPFPHAAPVDTTILTGQATTVEIAYDSGIR